jgi:NAD(P)H dehydrogenase (quinone)
MLRVLVLYNSSYGHIEAMAASVFEGAREAGALVDIARVSELVSDKVARDSHWRWQHPVRTTVVANGEFPGQACGLWARGALHGKVGGAFTSSATHHGGQETTRNSSKRA